VLDAARDCLKALHTSQVDRQALKAYQPCVLFICPTVGTLLEFHEGFRTTQLYVHSIMTSHLSYCCFSRCRPAKAALCSSLDGVSD